MMNDLTSAPIEIAKAAAKVDSATTAVTPKKNPSGTAASSPHAPTAPNETLGALLIIVAFFLVAVMSALGKLAVGLSPTTLVFFQSSISLILLLPLALRRGASQLNTRHIGLHMIRALTGALSQGLMFIAIKKMPLMNAVLLSNSAPLFIPLIAAAWLKQKISFKTFASLLIGFIGVIFILRPDRSLFENPASLLAALAAACSAVALVSVNRLSATETTERILFYYFLISTLVTAPFLFLESSSITQLQWIELAGIGVCMALAQFFIVMAYRYATASVIAPFNYTVVIFSGFLGWFIWHNTLAWQALVGTLLVSVGGILSTLSSQPNARGHLMWPGHLNIHWPNRWHHRLNKGAPLENPSHLR